MEENEKLEQVLMKLDEKKPGKISRITKGILVPGYLFRTLHEEKELYGKNSSGTYVEALQIEMFKSLVWGATIGGSIVSFFYH